MKEPNWIEKADFLAVHSELLALFGGLDGLRDPGRLDAALDRPKNLFAYEDPDIFDLAASYAHGIVVNHPFNDGNKRTGFVTAALFLETNGLSLTATEEAAVSMTLALASTEMSEKAYARWLADSSEPR
jgi:death on curing protein